MSTIKRLPCNVEPWPTGNTCMQPVGGKIAYWGNARDLSGATRCNQPMFVTWRDGNGDTEECINGHRVGNLYRMLPNRQAMRVEDFEHAHSTRARRTVGAFEQQIRDEITADDAWHVHLRSLPTWQRNGALMGRA